MRKNIFLNKRIMVLAGIIAVGALLRFIGADWGLPTMLHPDEGVITEEAYRLASTHSFETKNYNRPDHITIRANALLYLVVNKLFYGIWDNTPLKDKGIETNFYLHTRLFLTASRMFSGLLGVFSIVLAYLIMRRFHPDIGLLAAGMFAVFPSFIEHSHYITPEIPQTFLMLLTVFFTLLYMEKKSVHILALACFTAALAFCEKYPALYSCVIIAYGVFCAHYIKGEKIFFGKRGLLFTRLVYAVFSYSISIFLISPVLFINCRAVFRAIMFENRTGHLGADGLGLLGNFLFYLGQYLNLGGIVLFLMAFTGIYYGLTHYKKIRNVSVVLILSALYGLFLSIFSLHWERWGVPMYAAMLMLSAAGLYHLNDLLRDVIRKTTSSKFTDGAEKTIRIAVAALSVLVFINLFSASLAKTANFAATDTRIVSSGFCEENGITRENACFEAYTPLSPTGPGTVFEQFDNYDPAKPKNGAIRYVILSSSMYNRYYAEPERYRNEIKFYESLKTGCKLIKTFTPAVTGKPAGITSRTNFVEIINIFKSLSVFCRFLKGEPSGPELLFYQLGGT
jgi:hypothetical protein